MSSESMHELKQTAVTKKAFIYRHVVTFEETNVVGNVYFVRHFNWQGHCRELFLKEHAPEILTEVARDLRLVTVRASCDYEAELFAFDDIEIRMTRAHDQGNNSIGLDFVYLRQSNRELSEVARGFQKIVCMRQTGGQEASRCPIPESLTRALDAYR